MTIEISAEMVRLLGILADCPEGSTEHELTMQGVKSSLIYEAVMLNLVRVETEQVLGLAAYRFHILPAGARLLAVQNDRRGKRR
jgi:hypothetical protein